MRTGILESKKEVLVAPPSSVDYSSAKYIYSFDKLIPEYTGFCLKVRRDGANPAELDIGFVNGFLDTSAMLAFVGSNNGFLTIWYDQKGNSNLIQSDTSFQPVLVSSGVLEVENGRACSLFTSGTRMYTVSSTALIPTTYFVTSKRLSGTSRQDIVSFGDSSSAKLLLYHNNETTIGIFSGSILGSSFPNTNLNVTTGLFNGANSKIRINGIQTAFGSTGFVSGDGWIVVGSNRSYNGGFFKGKMMEIIIFEGDKSNEFNDIETDTNARISIY